MQQKPDWPCLTDWAAKVDWSQVVEAAQILGLGPILYYRLSRFTPTLAPESAMERLKRAYYQNVFANDLRQRELGVVARALSSQGIPIVVLKGAALALTVYPNPGVRFMGDIDLLVRPNQAELALETLRGLGYTSAIREARYSWEFIVGYTRHVPLVRQVQGKGLALELHWSLLHETWPTCTTGLDIDGLWARAEPLLQEGWQAWQFNPVDSLLHQVLHAAAIHSFTELGVRLFLDIDQLAHTFGDRPDFWPTVVERAQASRLGASSYYTLQLCQLLLNTPIPAEVLAALHPSSAQIALFQRAFTPAMILQRVSPTGWVKWAIRLALLDRRVDALLALAAALFPSTGWIQSYYNLHSPVQVLAHRLWHPLRVMRRGGL